DQTGQAKVGFPAGQGGLIHRFFQGYLVPAFTGGVVTTYTLSAPAWQWLADIWPYVHPQSVGFEFMQEPLLSGEVWVAWDHVARLKNALEQRPDDFVAVPAPAGPEGLAFMPVIAGLAIPETAPNQDGARELIHFLTETSTQAATLREVGFFPVVSGDLPGDLSAGIAAEAEAVTAQAGAPNALPSLLPIGLGERGGDFNKVYLDAFQRIILGGEDIQTVLTEEAQDLESIMQETQAPCWAPDPASDGPCPVG
ncbi:MAG: extracellular solute-binding protein, partial [Acidimicrobiia bacterium]